MVGEMILEIYTLFDLPLPESHDGRREEIARLVMVWTNALIRTVPEDSLRETFDYAIDHHTSPRALNAMDLKLAYPAMAAERMRCEAAASRSVAAEINRCGYCGGEGVKVYWLPSSGEEPELPCDECRPEAHAHARSEWIKKHLAGVTPRGTAEEIAIARAELASELDQ